METRVNWKMMEAKETLSLIETSTAATLHSEPALFPCSTYHC